MFDQLMKVSRGFKLIYVGFLICIISAILLVFAFFLLIAAAAGQIRGGAGGAGGAAGGPAPLAALGTAGVAIAVVFCLVILGGAITSFVGKFFCLAIPERAGPAKQLVLTSIVLEVISIVVQFSVGFLIGVQVLGNQIVQQIIQLGGYACGFVAYILFLLFTKHAARFIRNRELEGYASLVLKMVVATTVLYFLMIAITIGMLVVGGAGARGGLGAGGAPAGAMAGGCVVVCLALVVLILALITSIMYIILMVRMSTGIARYAKRVRDEDLDDEEEDWADEDRHVRVRDRHDRDEDYEDRDDDRDRDDDEDEHFGRRERRDRL